MPIISCSKILPCDVSLVAKKSLKATTRNAYIGKIPIYFFERTYTIPFKQNRSYEPHPLIWRRLIFNDFRASRKTGSFLLPIFQLQKGVQRNV